MRVALFPFVVLFGLQQLLLVEGRKLRGMATPSEANDHVDGDGEETEIEVSPEAEDGGEVSADKELERMHLNNLLGYSEKEAEEDEKGDIEEKDAEDGTGEDDADQEAALDEAEAEEHRKTEGAFLQQTKDDASLDDEELSEELSDRSTVEGTQDGNGGAPDDDELNEELDENLSKAGANGDDYEDYEDSDHERIGFDDE